MEPWASKVPELANRIQKLGVSDRSKSLNLARYVYQALNDAKLSGNSNKKEFVNALRDMGERALKESKSKKPLAKITHTAMREVWLQIENKAPPSVQKDKFIQGIRNRISQDIIKENKIVELTNAGHTRGARERSNIDTQEVYNKQFEVESNKTAGLSPDQVPNKDKLVKKQPQKTNVSSKQGIMWDRASSFEVDPEVMERSIRRSKFESGTHELSKFVKGKQVEYKKKFKGGGKKQDFAGLGAEVSGQKVLE